MGRATQQLGDVCVMLHVERTPWCLKKAMRVVCGLAVRRHSGHAAVLRACEGTDQNPQDVVPKFKLTDTSCMGWPTDCF